MDRGAPYNAYVADEDACTQSPPIKDLLSRRDRSLNFVGN